GPPGELATTILTGRSRYAARAVPTRRMAGAAMPTVRAARLLRTWRRGDAIFHHRYAVSRPRSHSREGIEAAPSTRAPRKLIVGLPPFSDASRYRPPRAPCPNGESPWKSGRSDEDRPLPSPCRPRSHPLSHRSEDGFLGTALRFPQATVCRDGRESTRR